MRWPLISAQKDSNNEYKPPEDIKRRGSTIAGDEGVRRTGREETRDLRRESSQDRHGQGIRSRPVGEESGLSQWLR